ncbi:MAG: SpvB/TcaC N-terminal domain-containing protein [Syntrophothermus sp.]
MNGNLARYNRSGLAVKSLLAILILFILALAMFGLSQVALHEDSNRAGDSIKKVAANKEDSVKQSAASGEAVVVDAHTENAFPDQATVVSFGQVKLELPAGAVKEPVQITVEKLQKVNELNPGLSNSTGGAVGYRFKPDGLKFLKAVRVTIPYNRAAVKDDYDLNNLYTYFYNKDSRHWEQLQRAGVDPKNGLVTSLTTHFTDMINGVLKLPESPKPLSFNPTSIKEIKAADPSAKINLMAPPEGNAQGAAGLSYPIEAPPGRNGMQAQVSMQYNSDAENGWMGLGWDISYPSISIDTRWGVPRYSPVEETETYILNGMQLTPLAHRGALQPRSAEKVFHARVEGGFDKIVRHGDKPANYWWETTDKKGTRSFYGGTPENGLIKGAVLYDRTSGNVFKWALVQIRDANGNTVDYEYSQIEDIGVGDGTVVGGTADYGAERVPGVQLYLKAIRYTGTAGHPGAYSVNFLRDRDLKEPRRPDVTIDARAGFKVVTSDLLRKIEVKFGDQMIRSYEFKYREGAFQKTLLETVVQYGQDGREFNRHSFTYYDEVSSGGAYNGFSSPAGVNTGDDRISATLLGFKSVNATALGGTSTRGTGGHLYVGVGGPIKDLTGGYKTGFSNSDSEDLLALIDLNGDGLPDKVFKEGGNFYYRPGRLSSGKVAALGDKVPLPTLPGISRESSSTGTGGPEGYYGGWSLVINHSGTTTTGTTYFSDVNGDGLPDLVDGGQVYFNHLENGVPTFVFNDSSQTPAPIAAGRVDTNGLAVSLTTIYERMIDNSPLIDAVRSWKAPFDGRIAINAPVRLLPYDQNNNRGADGVRVAIQQNDRELWSDRIAAGDFVEHVPAGLESLDVRRGDRIYFRVQSVFNGAADQVEWDPEITYLNVPLGTRDANGQTPYRYKASEDFVYAGRGGEMVAPITGTIRLRGALKKKGVTTDEIRLMVYQNGNPVITRSLGWEATGEINLDEEFNVNAQDRLRLAAAVDSPIDLTRIEWAAEAYYTSVADPTIPVYNEDGQPAIRVNAAYDIDFYPVNNLNGAQEYWEAPRDGKVVVTSSLTISEGLSDNQVTFTVKKSGALLGKTVLDFDGGTSSKPAILVVPVMKGDRLYFDFTGRDPYLVEQAKSRSVTLIYDDARSTRERVTVGSAVHSPAIANLLPAPYRGWSYFGYNGNRERAGEPIHESDLVVDEDYAKKEQPKAFLMFPMPEKGYWGSEVGLCWVGAGKASSSRVGNAAISVPTIGDLSGARGVSRLSTAYQDSVGGGWAFASYSRSSGSSSGVVDFLDLNGDRFPDILSASKVQYSTMTGGLEESARAVLPGEVRRNSNTAENGGIGGNVPLIVQSARGDTTGSTKGNSKWLMAPLGLQLNVNIVDKGDSQAVRDLIDMNGDGLPDQVSQDGEEIRVALNLGYGFAPPETWGSGALNVGRTKNPPVGASLGWNTGNYGFAGGFSTTAASRGRRRGWPISTATG